ncbi:diacylglycerol kinase family protein [Dongia soli]|uniref:Diacylglycerol kinase family protein n=1 Tax=Dongia soli TaxID=600628 RepID=A0ABU5EA78_9PROT|nr:diacylglycerol kinase family protein [Dongia soli]MDY0883139.1 diacylglycerol kinase family protein [Dongia soli]
MTRIGLISNARSTRNLESIADVHDLLEAHPDVMHLVFHNIHELSDALDEMAAQSVTHLAISGGDGTVQAAVNHLIKDKPFAQMPKISLISGGMTNVIAIDVGMPGKPARALKQLIERVKAGDAGTSLDRSLIALSLDGGTTQTYGFFGGAVSFYQGTMLSQKGRQNGEEHRSLAANATILLSLLRVLWYGPGPRSGFHGERITIAKDDGERREQDVFLLLLTTLHRLLPGVMPFWGDASKTIRYTLMDHPPQRFLCAVWPMLRGRARPWFEDAGYHSGSLNHLALMLSTPFVMDGELFTPNPGNGLQISAGPAIRFHRF